MPQKHFSGLPFVQKLMLTVRGQCAQFRQELEDHEKFEERLLYPRLRRELGEKAPINQTEHIKIEELLQRLFQAVTLREERLLMKKLRNAITSHFKNEERYLLPAAHNVLGEADCERMTQILNQMERGDRQVLDNLHRSATRWPSLPQDRRRSRQKRNRE